jgi:DNA-binding ferritin-like protein
MMLKRPYNDVDKAVSNVVVEMIELSICTHKLHLSITGAGSYAAHKTLGDFYTGIRDFADSLVEQYQGASEKILEIPMIEEKYSLKSVKDAVSYLREMSANVNELQRVIPYSEIVNLLDEVKSLVNTTKYKLLFLS